MRSLDFDPEIAELVDGVPTAKNQEGDTLESLIKEFKSLSDNDLEEDEESSIFDGFPLD